MSVYDELGRTHEDILQTDTKIKLMVSYDFLKK